MTAADHLVLAGEYPSRLAELLKGAVKPDMGAEAAARACYSVLRDVCKAAGQKPEIETFLKQPGQDSRRETVGAWWVCWEAGPHDWGVAASFTVMQALGGRVVETYYGFDLLFYTAELGA